MAHTRWRAAPDGLIAAALLSFLATAGFFYVNVMPAMVSGLIQGLHFSAQQAGRVAAANVYGAALGALAAVAVVRSVRWRPLAYAALCVLLALDALSLDIRAPATLAAIRLAHGITGGLLVGTAFSVIARTRHPDRTFGMLLVVQYGMGGLGLLLIPPLVERHGAPVIFLALGAFTLLTLLMVPFLAEYPKKFVTRKPVDASAERWPARITLTGALVAVLLFQAGNMALSAFDIELGRAFGLGTAGISTTLATTNWLGAAGAVLMMTVGLRWGRHPPLLLGTALAALGTLLFHWSALWLAFMAANLITALAWSFTIPFLLGLCAAQDASGRAATLASFCSKVGLATGPLTAGWIVGSGDWGLLINLSAAALAVSAACAVWPARQLDSRGDGASADGLS
jgi:DHA1 family inner membrane transport protein